VLRVLRPALDVWYQLAARETSWQLFSHACCKATVLCMYDLTVD